MKIIVFENFLKIAEKVELGFSASFEIFLRQNYIYLLPSFSPTVPLRDDQANCGAAMGAVSLE